MSEENNNINFKVEKLKYYPEDIEKMEKMSVCERIEYRRKLKKENRYIIIDENEQ